MLFAVNPDFAGRRIELGALAGEWRQWADRDRFWGEDETALRRDARDFLDLPPLGCGLWVSSV